MTDNTLTRKQRVQMLLIKMQILGVGAAVRHGHHLADAHLEACRAYLAGGGATNFHLDRVLEDWEDFVDPQ